MSVATLTRAEMATRLAGDRADRAAFLREAAEEGLADAQALYGQLLLDGDGVAADPVAAFGWFNRAGAQHHLMALNMVGRCYDQGWGVAIDYPRAAACFQSAAESGLAEGMYNYATALTLGTGVAEDKVAALAWFERAAARDYAKAINFVGSFAEDGWAGPVDLAKAADCYARAAAGGDFRGAFNHARMLAERDRAAALEWIARAGEWGNQRFLGQARAWLGESTLGVEGVAALERGAARC
ncbi:MAG: tetratricopeptide repeat protein [Pseudomonadota bacterium]